MPRLRLRRTKRPTRPLRTDAFDFELPEELIALRPAEPRGAAHLLVVEGMSLTDARVADLPSFLKPGDLIVVNDTKVIPARLFAIRPARNEDGPPARIELLLHRRLDARRYEAFARPAKRLRAGDELSFGNCPLTLTLSPGGEGTQEARQERPLPSGERDGVRGKSLSAHVDAKGEDGLVTLAFDATGAALDTAIAEIGEMPLPPYIAGRRAVDARDSEDYQTVFARTSGAVAAPTAGLHFTPELFAALEARGIARIAVTLHVGAGTFLPVKAEETGDHVMHAEWGEVTPEAAARINAARAAGGRIIAIGTTSLRILESACDAAGRIQPFSGDTRIFLTPGAEIRSADLLFTNFHLPRSTLFMLVQAFGGIAPLRAAYAHAIDQRYRFYSYGDACLIARQALGQARG